VSRPPAGPVSQLAAAAGYDVITTASPHNADYVRGLGASQVFDYRSPTAVADLTQALRGCTLAGTIGTGSAEACLDVVHAATGSKVIATASTAVSFEHLADTPRADPAPDRADQPDAARHRRAAAAIPQTGHPHHRHLGQHPQGQRGRPSLLRRLPAAGPPDHRYLAAPEPNVVGTGLDHLQNALTAHIRGVSASKIVVMLGPPRFHPPPHGQSLPGSRRCRPRS